MKQRKTLVTLGLVVAILVLGVGYAMSNIELSINGKVSATVSDENFKVAFDGTPSTTTSSTDVTAEASITADTNNLAAEMTVSNLSTIGDKATATFTIKNSSTDLGADLSAVITQVSGTYKDYFKVSVNEAWNDTVSVAAGQSTTIEVTVELIKTPIEAINDQTFSVAITATPTQS